MAHPLALPDLVIRLVKTLRLGLKNDPNLMLDALWDATIAVGLLSVPFTDLLVHPGLSLCPPFDPDVKKDHLLLILDNLSSPQAIKTLLYTGITLISRNDIYKWASFRDEHKIDAMLEAFFKAWKPVQAYSPVHMPVEIPPTPPTYDRDTVSPPPPPPNPLPTEFNAEMVEATDTSSSSEDSRLPMPTPRPLEKGKWKPGSTLDIVRQAPVSPSSPPSLQPVTKVISPAVTTARVRRESQPLGEGARPPASGRPSMPPPRSGGLTDSAWTETGMEASHTKGGKAKGKGKGETFAEVASKAMLKPVGVEPPCRQTKITDTFRPAQTNTKPARPPPPPTRPSLVLALTHHTLSTMLKAKADILAPALVEICNAALASDPIHANIQLSAAKWTPIGNLVVFAGPGVSCDTLFATSHLLTTTISWALPEHLMISSRLNVKWGKVLINSVPTGVVEGHPHAHSPPTCWQVLIDNNPSFRNLKVCQLPSWVCHPSLFTLGLSSSLVLTFEDPDGTIAPSLIRACNMYAFGAQCRIKAWKQPPPSPAKRAVKKLAKDLHRVQSEALAQHLDDVAKTMPVSSSRVKASAPARTSVDLVTAATFSETGDKRSPPSPPQKPSPSKRKKRAGR